MIAGSLVRVVSGVSRVSGVSIVSRVCAGSGVS